MVCTVKQILGRLKWNRYVLDNRNGDVSFIDEEFFIEGIYQVAYSPVGYKYYCISNRYSIDVNNFTHAFICMECVFPYWRHFSHTNGIYPPDMHPEPKKRLSTE